MGRDNRRTRLLLFALLATALALITVDYRVNGADSRLRSGLHDVVGPIERGLSDVTSPISNVFNSSKDASNERKRADRLQSENDDLRRQLAAGAEAQRLAASLARLRLLADKGSFSIVPTRVIATGDVTGTEQTVDVDAGTADGLTEGQLVIDGDGLVGVVQRAGGSTSTIRLAIDPATVIGARLEGSQALGSITGAGPNGKIYFTLYDPTLPLKPGTRVVTYGSADYAGGVPVGTITQQVQGSEGLSRRAEVAPFVKFGSLDLVGVVVKRPATNPGDRLLPPRPVPPAPAPTPPAVVPGATTGTAPTTSRTGTRG